METHGTIFHGKQAAVELIVRVLACLAEGLGIRATARVFELFGMTAFSFYWLSITEARTISTSRGWAGGDRSTSVIVGRGAGAATPARPTK